MKEQNEKVIKQYFAAWEKKDWDILLTLLSDDFTFSSPNKDDHINIEEYKKRCWVGADIIDRYDIEIIVSEGENVFVTYRCWWKDGKTTYRCAEHFRIKDSKIKDIDGFWGFIPQNIKAMADVVSK